MDVNAEFNLLYYLPFVFKGIDIYGAKIDVVLESTSDDNLHFKLADDATLTVDRVNITMQNPLLNKIVEAADTLIQLGVGALLPDITKILDTKIAALN
jgi:hypothetical protein